MRLEHQTYWQTRYLALKQLYDEHRDYPRRAVAEDIWNALNEARAKLLETVETL